MFFCFLLPSKILAYIFQKLKNENKLKPTHTTTKSARLSCQLLGSLLLVNITEMEDDELKKDFPMPIERVFGF